MKAIDDPPLHVTLPAELELPVPTARPREEHAGPVVASAMFLRRSPRRR
jgi:hypothetical protein